MSDIQTCPITTQHFMLSEDSERKLPMLSAEVSELEGMSGKRITDNFDIMCPFTQKKHKVHCMGSVRDAEGDVLYWDYVGTDSSTIVRLFND